MPESSPVPEGFGAEWSAGQREALNHGPLSGRVFFVRTDSSWQIGGGHVMRCLALAEALRGRGAEVHFICRDLRRHAGRAIEEAGFTLHLFPSPPLEGRRPGTVHGAWLETSEAVDAEQTIEVLARERGRVDWLIVDHYALDRGWEERVSPYAQRMLIIDDLADRLHVGDALLDQSLVDTPAARYASLVPSECRLLLGPSFALLRREFARQRARAQIRAGHLGRLFISLGALDGKNQTVKALAAVERAGLTGLKIDVVAGLNTPHLEGIRAACARLRDCRLHAPAENMAELMAAADLAIGAGGVTGWERCCLGLPTLLIQVGANQEGMARALDRAGAALFLGDYTEVTVEQIAEALQRFASDRAALARMSAAAQALVDGNGALRVAAFLGPVQLRRAESGDARLLFDWANDPVVRAHSFHPEPIAWETHERWYEAKQRSTECFIFIGSVGEEPIGQVRFDWAGEIATVDISLAVQKRNRGFGLELLLKGIAAMEQLRPGGEFRAEVKQENEPSRRLFELAGFTAGVERRPGVEVFQYKAGR